MIPAIVLAAGLSRRMGSNKLLMDFRGKPLVHYIIEALLDSASGDILIITGFEADRIRDCCSVLSDSMTFIHNPQYNSGRVSSVLAGVNALPKETTAALIAPGDVPFVSPELINSLIASYREKGRITFPVHSGTKGHPVIFPDSAFPLLRNLSGEQTLNDMLLRNPAITHPVTWNDPGCSYDVDTEHDLLHAPGEDRTV